MGITFVSLLQEHIKQFFNQNQIKNFKENPLKVLKSAQFPQPRNKSNKKVVK